MTKYDRPTCVNCYKIVIIFIKN